MNSISQQAQQRTDSTQVRRWFYADEISDFLNRSPQHIIGCLSRASAGVETTQLNAWSGQITLLQEALRGLDSSGQVYFEYIIPRLGKRIDCVLLIKHVLFVLEFKVGESDFNAAALDQVWDYALDLKNFHESSHELPIAPLLIATEAAPIEIKPLGTIHDDQLLRPVRVGRGQIANALRACLSGWYLRSDMGGGPLLAYPDNRRSCKSPLCGS